MTRRESLQNAGWDLRDPPAPSTDQSSSKKTDENAAPPEPRDGKPATDAGGLQADETKPQDKPAPSVPESDNTKTSETGNLRALTDDQNTGNAGEKPEPEFGETRPQAEQDGQANQRDDDIPASEQPTTNSPSDTDRATGQIPKDQDGTSNSETKPSQEKDPKPETPETPPQAEQLPGTDKLTAVTTDAAPQPTTPETATIPAESPEHGTRPQEQQPEPISFTEDETRDAPADQRPAHDAPSSPTETRDHDKKAEEPDLPAPFTGNNPPDRDPPQTGETEEPGRELGTHEENLPEPEPNPYRARITLQRDSDGNFVQERRFDIEDDAPSRAEPRNPEDDPELRDYQESDPERQSRPRELYRTLITKTDDTKDIAEKFTDPAHKKLERVKPTGQLCGVRVIDDHIKSLDQPAKVGDATIGVLGTVVFTTEMARLGIKAVRRMKGRSDARN